MGPHAEQGLWERGKIGIRKGGRRRRRKETEEEGGLHGSLFAREPWHTPHASHPPRPHSPPLPPLLFPRGLSPHPAPPSPFQFLDLTPLLSPFPWWVFSEINFKFSFFKKKTTCTVDWLNPISSNHLIIIIILLLSDPPLQPFWRFQAYLIPWDILW